MLRINPAAQVNDATTEEMLGTLSPAERDELLILIGKAAAETARQPAEGDPASS